MNEARTWPQTTNDDDSISSESRLLVFALALVAAPVLAAQPPAPAAAPVEHTPGGEVNIHLPDLNQGDFLGLTGHQILLSGLVVCVLGLLFGAWTYSNVKNLPVHRSMAEISELIYETCKAYLVQQGKFLLILEVFIGAGDGRLLLADRARGLQDRHRAALQPDRHRRQLRRGVVRHSNQHAREFTYRVCESARQSVRRCATFRCRPA